MSYLVLVLKDFPEIFWCDGRVSATAYTGEEATQCWNLGISIKRKKKEAEQEIRKRRPRVAFRDARRMPAIMRRSSTCMRLL